MNNHNPAQSSIAPALNVIGICMLLVGILTAIYLYQSFAVTLLEKVIYGLFGFFFSLLSGVLPVASHHLGRAGHGSLAIVAWLIWFTVCFAIGTQTHLGFMANSQAHYEQETARNSLASQVAKSDLEQANGKLETLSQYASLDVEALTVQKNTLESELNNLNTSLSACPANFFKNCINPLKAQISEQEKALQTVVTSLTAFQQYQGAINSKSLALSAMQSAGMIKDTDSMVHPLFITQARLMSFNPSLMQSFFLAFSAVAYEVLTAFVLLLGSKLSVATYQNTRAGYQVNTRPQYQQLPRYEDDDEIELFLPVDEKKSNQPVDELVNNQPVDELVSNQLVNELVNNQLVIEGVEFVPSELSGIASKGRVGKKDHCVECGNEFVVKAYQQVRCPTCSEKARVSYRGTLKQGKKA
ncbi:hypothetical protein [Beggiatoa leptomitoformis]|uniref:Uncharacterized protein n=1 Tax=Beggiatoa leptomitoformis TaxID=288004 RepID=A0A2N9YCU6_9GAMM|nr:hypothetical protein [Beggiatoa leptomitoformis]ALG66438.1 hypothetical protein AL038_00145 [Beggiatoa leptomitoformis]AUI68283.1 hypothetical protein BLE401_05930 [Beggiatoa leptomitoformis]